MRWFRGLAYGWAGFLLCLWLLEEFLAPHFLLLAIATALPHSPLLLPGLLALAFAAWRRDRPLVLSLALSQLVLLFGLENLQLPLARLGPDASGLRLRVASLNLAGLPYGEEAARAALEKARGDLVGLQEIQIWNERTRSLMPDRPWQVAQAGEFGLLSRYPVQAYRLEELAPAGETRPALVVDLELEGRPATVVVVHYIVPFHGLAALQRPHLRDHLARSRSSRAYAADRLMALLDTLPGPVIVLGDFNSRPPDPIIRGLRHRLQDCWNSGWGFGYTYDTDMPLIRIDYVLASRDFQLRRAWVESALCSDHRLLVADLVLRR